MAVVGVTSTADILCMYEGNYASTWLHRQFINAYLPAVSPIVPARGFYYYGESPRVTYANLPTLGGKVPDLALNDVAGPCADNQASVAITTTGATGTVTFNGYLPYQDNVNPIARTPLNNYELLARATSPLVWRFPAIRTATTSYARNASIAVNLSNILPGAWTPGLRISLVPSTATSVTANSGVAIVGSSTATASTTLTAPATAGNYKIVVFTGGSSPRVVTTANITVL
jgi:hypothetical protein